MILINETNYVDQAEQVIKGLKNKKNDRGRTIPQVTTSKIRNLLSLTADIYNEVMVLQDETLPEEIRGRIEYLRMRAVYEAGRDESVKAFVLDAKILEILKSIGNKKSEYILFNRYMESLVAFHKFYDGRD